SVIPAFTPTYKPVQSHAGATGATFFSAVGIGPAKAGTTAANTTATKQNLVKDSFMKAESGDLFTGRQQEKITFLRLAARTDRSGSSLAHPESDVANDVPAEA